MRLFLSYSRKDRKIVDELAGVLRNGGQEVWIDDQIRAGTQWRVALREAIEQSDGIVLALTPNWIASPYCQWEFITAAELGKKVIPVLLSETDIPARISQYQYAKFVDGFTDADRVQRFLDDLLLLAAEIDIGAVDMSSKAELERQIDQQIQTGNITDSTVDATQKSDGTDKRGNQVVATGDITGSTITFNQQTTTIGNQTIHQGEKQRNWTLPVIIVLVMISIITALLVSDRLPEGSPDPIPLPAGFNVVVAGFAYESPEGNLIRNTEADSISDILTSELNQITQVDNTVGWRTAGVGHILGETSAEREEQAAAIANTLNASVVIYGIVRSEGIFLIIEPEFYVPGGYTAIEPELAGADQLGTPIEVIGSSPDELLAANSFQRRITVMRHFLRGLVFYINGSFADSVVEYQTAIAVEEDGLEALYVFAGNAAVRVPDTFQALEFYDSALRQRPDYARGLIGRGIALYNLARETTGDNRPPNNPSLTLDPKQTCADVDVELPEDAQLLAELALRCYREARLSPDQLETADIDVKSAFGIGQVSLWLSINGYADHWDVVQAELSEVTELYEASSDARQTRIRTATAHAHAWLGLRLLSIDGNDTTSVCTALDHYQQALALLEDDDFNRNYNREWIDLYGEQIVELEDWIDDSNDSCNDSMP